MIQIWLLRLLPWVLLAALCGTFYWYLTALQEAKEKADARVIQLQTSLDGHIATERALRGNLQALQDAIAEREAVSAANVSRHRADTGKLRTAVTTAPAGQEWAPAAVPDAVRRVLKAATGAPAPAGGAAGASDGAVAADPDAGVRSDHQPGPGAVRPGPDIGASAGKRG